MPRTTTGSAAPRHALNPLLLAMAAAGIYGGGIARAATYTVTNLNDSGAGSLRQTIATANSNPGPHEILFQNGLNGTINLTSGQIVIDESMYIVGPGPDRLTISGNDNSRVFRINAVDDPVILYGLRIVDGNGRDTAPGDPQGPGGCIHAEATLALVESVVSGCSASGTGGGIQAAGFEFADPGDIGDKYDHGLILYDSTISGNTVICGAGSTDDCGGGGAAASFVMSKYSAVLDNTVDGSGDFVDADVLQAGGGLLAFGAYIMQTTVSGNTLTGNTSTTGDLGRVGGGIAAGGAIVIGTTIDNNSIGDNAGGSVDGDTLFTGGGIATTFTQGMIQSTISGNTVPAGAHGAGVAMGLKYDLGGGGGGGEGDESKYGGIANSTIADNSGASAISSIATDYTGFLLSSTIVTNTTGGMGIHCDPACTIEGTHNLVRDGWTGVTFDDADPLTVDPQLGPLMYNGGFQTGAPGFRVGIRTHALAETSPAIDQGTPFDGPSLENDQRGSPYPRLVGAGVDIGAYEWNPNEVPTLGAWGLGLLSSMLAFAGWRRRRLH